MKKRILSTLLSAAMIISFVPNVTLAEETENKNLVIEAAYEEPVTITKVNEPGEEILGDLTIENSTFYLDRDYAQCCNITVTNNSDIAHKYYLSCANPYEDIYMNFVKGGSKDDPLIIQANETQIIELSVFMQNAEKTSYQIPITAYVVDDEEKIETTTSVSIMCEQPEFNISHSLLNSDKATLTNTYRLTNNGETLSDVNVYMTGEAEEYAKFMPVISNFELICNESVEFKVAPDLTKMKANNKTVVSGTMVVKCGGQTKEIAVSFDTKGQKITTTTMGELSLIQEGNPYVDLEFNEDSFSFTTSSSGTEMTFSDITSKYYEEGNPDKDGVNTPEELKEVVDTIINPETGMIDFNVSTTLINGDEEIPVSVNISTEVVSNTDVALFSEEENYKIYYKDETLTTEQTTYMLPEELIEIYDQMQGTLEYLHIEETEEKILGNFNFNDDPDVKIALNVKTSIKSGTLELLDEFAGDLDVGKVDTELLNAVSPSKLNSLNQLGNDMLPVISLNKAYGDVMNVAESIGDGMKCYNTWQNPNVTTSEKVQYSTLLVAKNINTYVGGKVLSKVGTSIGTAVADGPGAVVGYVTGYVLSGLIDYSLKQYIGELENSYGGAIYYDIYGRQCTNAGKVTTNFYVPDFDNDDVEMYDTGRMYDGSYVNSAQTNYQYYLNGKAVGLSQNGGLTEVSIVKLPTDNLKPGQINTIVRDYDTNPGSHFVTADSEITLVYPADAEISYIGSPDTLEDVRLLPDFVVYPENINATGDIIRNEATTLNVNLYNRGSNAGWTTVVVKENGTEIYKEENCYIKAFSAKEISFDWTPKSSNNNISVELINTSINLEERKSDNNNASKSIPARERMVPVIENLAPQSTYSDAPIYLTAEISNINDIKNVVFYLDSKVVEGTIEESKINNTKTLYSLKVPALEKGTHTFKAEVEYFTGKEESAKTDSSVEIVSTGNNTISLELDDAMTNPKFYILQITDGSSLIENNVNAQKNDKKYSIKQTQDMYSNPDNYYLLVTFDTGMTYVKLSELTDEALSLDKCKCVEIKLDDKTTLQRLRIGEVTINGKYYNIYTTYRSLKDNKLYLPSGEYEFYAYFEYENFSFGKSLNNIKVENDDIVVDPDINIKTYKFSLPDEDFSNEYNYIDRSLIIDGWSAGINYYTDSSNKEIGFAITDSYTLEKLEEAEEAYIFIGTSNSLYKVDILSDNIPATLKRSSLKEVSVVMKDSSACEIDTILLSDKRNLYQYFSSEKFYVPAGSYSVSVSYTNKGKKLSYKGDLEVSSSEKNIKITLPAVNDTHTPIAVTWPETYKIGRIADVTNGNGAYINIEQNEELLYEKGNHIFNFILYKNSNYDNYIELTKAVELENEKVLVEIDNKFTGDIYWFDANEYDGKYFGNGYFSLDIENLFDKYDNELTYFYADDNDDYLSGYARFTSVDDETKYYDVPVHGYSLYSLEGNLPNVDGEFYVSLHVSDIGYHEEGDEDDDDEEDSKEFHTITATAGEGGKISPSGKVSVEEGKNISFTMKPSSNYVVSNVIVDGKSVGKNTKYTFRNVTKNHTIEVEFSKKKKTNSASNTTSSYIPLTQPDDKEEAASPVKKFSDVKETDWYYEAVKFVSERKITNGISDTSFAPNAKVTRGQFITMLCRAYKIPETNGDNFDDCGNTWYTGYLAAAKQLGISNGIGDNKFAPEKEITREEMVTLIYNYLKSIGKVDVETSETQFADNNNIADWAKAGVAFASTKGFVNGKGNNIFDPAGDATRAELAQIFYNMFK